MNTIYGINLEGLKPRPTYEELLNTKDVKIKHIDRSATLLRNHPLMTQVDYIGAFELEDQQRREIIQRQKEDMIRAIASNSDLTVQSLKAIAAKPSWKMTTPPPSDDITYMHENALSDIEQFEQRREQIAAGKRANIVKQLQDKKARIEAGYPVHGLVSAYVGSDQGNSVDDQSLGPNVVDESFYSPAGSAGMQMSDIDNEVTKLFDASELRLNTLLDDYNTKLNKRNTSKDNKILHIIQKFRGYDSPVKLISEIVYTNYGESTEELKCFPTFVLDRILSHRGIQFNANTSRDDKI